MQFAAGSKNKQSSTAVGDRARQASPVYSRLAPFLIDAQITSRRISRNGRPSCEDLHVQNQFSRCYARGLAPPGGYKGHRIQSAMPTGSWPRRTVPPPPDVWIYWCVDCLMFQPLIPTATAGDVVKECRMTTAGIRERSSDRCLLVYVLALCLINCMTAQFVDEGRIDYSAWMHDLGHIVLAYSQYYYTTIAANTWISILENLPEFVFFSI